jgi:hypothetical protein
MKKMMDAKDPTSVLDQYGLKDYKEKVDKEIGAQKIKLASFQKLITMYSKSSSEEYLAYEAKVKKSFPKTFEQFQASGGARYMNENTAFMKNLKDMVGSVSISAPAGTAKETANLTTAVSTLNTTMNATIPTNLEKTTVAVAAGTKQAKDDSFNLKNVLQQIFQAEANGYTKLLRQGEVTNELLSNVIDATLQGKNITMDSTRVNKALQKVKNNQYGLGSTVQTTTGVTGYASSIIAG